MQVILVSVSVHAAISQERHKAAPQQSEKAVRLYRFFTDCVGLNVGWEVWAGSSAACFCATAKLCTAVLVRAREGECTCPRITEEAVHTHPSSTKSEERFCRVTAFIWSCTGSPQLWLTQASELSFSRYVCLSWRSCTIIVVGDTIIAYLCCKENMFKIIL